MFTMGGTKMKQSLCALAIFALVVILSSAYLAAADSIQGCGGFVEASASLAKLRRPTDPKLDYSDMTVELHTLEGLIKDRTQCAPNGYYYLPVYDRGTFVIKIKGPDGWTFDPRKVTVTVHQDGCNDNEDINFRYTGFTVSGKVLSQGRAEGPPGVKIVLSRSGEGAEDNNGLTVTTSPGGSYEFVDLPSGEYFISASHPKWDVQLKGSPKVVVGWDNIAVEDIFSISGYSVEGYVASQGNPVLGVQVYLYSDDVPSVPCAQGPGKFGPLSKEALCHAVSDADGRFAFSAVPCGRYQLVPFYQGGNTVFDVSPSSIDITVDHDSVEIPKSFQVTGFSIGGRVIDTAGDGVEGVKILIEDTERATTDADGFYKLDQVTSSMQYTIKANKAHYNFSPLEKLKVLPNMASVPDIKATHYAVCGSINVITGEYSGKQQVALTHGPVKSQTKRTNDEGAFCFEVPPGDYRLSPVATSAEKSLGLLFTPQYLDISVKGPVLDATFSQAQVSVSGVVKFKGSFSPRVMISLVPASTTDASRKQSTSLAGAGGEFLFEKVFPGKYSVEVRHDPVSEGQSWDDDWSWEQKSLEIDVGIVDIIGLTFVQKGFLLRIKSTHATSAFTLQEHHDAMPLQIKRGWQEITLESPGIHELGFLWPCVFFGALSFQLDTSHPKPLYLVGQKYVLTGHLNIDSKLHPDPNQFSNSIFVDISQEDGVTHEVGVHLVAEANGTHPVAVYKYAHWAQLGDKLVISPRHLGRSSIDSGLKPTEESQEVKKVLFYPRDQKYHVESDSCQAEIPVFNGRLGVYVSGSVIPPQEGVNITVLPERDSDAGILKAGDIALWTLTGEDGTFSAGPLYDDTSYAVQAVKEGFYLKSIGDNTFSIQKLGQIVVNIVPGQGAEEMLPSVLLSLSGDDGYRKNAVTGSGGTFLFENLFPGSFYLRPVLKEYSFSPSAQAIEVGSGEVREVTFGARRIAYSVLGTVASLSGRPQEGVTLEARSNTGYYEETMTDYEGRYRLRGLLPNTTYTIKTIVKEESRLKMERASPTSVVVKVIENDIIGVDFVVFEEALTTVLTGTVEGADLEKWQPDIMIEVSSESEPNKVEKSVPLAPSYFFEVQGLPKGSYLVKLVFGLPTRSHKFFSDPVLVDLATRSQKHIGALTFSAREHFQSQDLTPAPVFPLVVGIVIIAVFSSLPKLKDAFQSVRGSSGSNNAASPKPKTEVRKAVSRTKRAF